MPKAKKYLPILFFIFVFFFFSSVYTTPSLAFIPEIPFDDMVHLADIVFVGTAAEQSPKTAKNRKMVETEVVFTQIRVIHQKDTVTDKIGNRVVLTYTGGRFNEAYTYVSDMPWIETGQRYLVFAYYDGQPHTNPFVGGNQGLLKIAADETTGKEYPLKIDGSGIAEVREGRLRPSPRVKKIRNGVPEKAESRMKIARAPGPRTPDEWPAKPRSHKARMSEKILGLDEMTGHIGKALKKGPSDRVQEKHRRRAAAVLYRHSLADQPVESEPNAWEFSDDGKIVILDPSRVNCLPVDQKTAGETGVGVQSDYDSSPPGGTSWKDIFIHGWHDLPVTMDMMPTNYWTYDYDTRAMANFELYIDDMFRVRPWDGGFAWFNGWSEFCGFLTEYQLWTKYARGWDDAIGICFYVSGLCESCQIFEADVAFNAEKNWTGDYKCQLARDEPGDCSEAYLYIKTATHELGHTLGLMCGGEETYDYDVPTVMNGGLNYAVEDSRGLHVGDTYLLRYWYADQRSAAAMNHDDMGIESWIAQGGTVNATTDKSRYNIGEQVSIDNITIENIGFNSAPDVRVRAFLSEEGELGSLISERNELDLSLIPADRLLIGPPPSNEYYVWDSMSANAFWTGALAFVIPDHIPMGNYYINLVLTANNDQSVVGAAPGDTSYHEITILNNHTFVKLPIEVTCPKPPAPTNFSQQGTDVDGVSLTWDAVENARYYSVSRINAANPAASTVLTSTLTTQTYKDTSAVPGTLYYYALRVQNQCRTWSDPVYIMGATRPLTPPCIQSATDGTSSEEVQVIAQHVDQGDYYCFYYSTVNDPTTAVQMPGECWTSDTSALHTGGTRGKTYYYWAKAATSDAGANATGLGGACPDNSGWRKLSPPTEITATQNDTEGIRITWNASPGATAYRLYRHTENDPATATAITDWWAGLLTYFDSPVDQGRQYYYWVRSAVESNGNRPSDFSASAVGWKSYTPAPKVDLTGLGATKGSYADKVKLSWWLAGNDSYYYRVYRTTDLSPFGEPIPNSAIPISAWQPSTASFDDTAATPGKDYGYFVSRAYDANGTRESDWQYCSACFDSGWRALSSPTGIGASPGTFADRIRITWPLAEGATYYRVHRGSSEAYSLINPPVPISDFITGTQFDDMEPALESKTIYYYWVTAAVNAAGDRESSSIGILGKRGYKASSPPEGVSATDGVHTDKIVITWNPVPGLSEYRVYRNTAYDPETATRLSAWQTLMNYDDETAEAGQVYYYWVSARLNSSDKEPSPFSDVDTGFRGFVPPAGVAASDGNYTDKVAVSWQASPGAGYYRVYRNTSDNPAEAVAVSFWQTALSYEDTDADVGSEYYYFVAAAVNNRGGLASGKGPGDAGHRVLAPPINLLTSQGTYKSFVGISWDKGNDESTHFRVFRSTVNDPTTAQPASGWQSAMVFDDTTITAGRTYYYWVKGAVDAGGSIESTWSNNEVGLSGYACATPEPPVNFVEQGTDADGIGLSWDSAIGDRRYKLLRNTANDADGAEVLAGELTGTIQLGTSSESVGELAGTAQKDTTSEALPGELTATVYKDASALPGTAYYYWVLVQNECMAWSDPAALAAPAIRPLGLTCIESVTDGTSTDEIQVTAQGVDSATHYCYYYNTEDEPDTAVALPGACWTPDTSIVHAGATPGQTYYYWAKAATSASGENAGDFGGACPDNSGWRKLLPPSGVLASDGVHFDKVAVTWQPAEGATHYRVYRNTVDNPAEAQAVSNWQSALAFDDTSVSLGQTYYYWVTGAVDEKGSRESDSETGDSGYTSPDPGDVDGNGSIDLTDAILTFQVVAGMPTQIGLYLGADVNSDGKISIEEAIYVLRKIGSTGLDNAVAPGLGPAPNSGDGSSDGSGF